MNFKNNVDLGKAVEKYLGRMNDPVSSAFLKGPCGDEMEFYLVIEKDKIMEIKFYTEGCEETKICGAMTAMLADGKKVEDALAVSPAEVKKRLPDLSQEHLHCTILAVSTLYRAVADYLLKA